MTREEGVRTNPFYFAGIPERGKTRGTVLPTLSLREEVSARGWPHRRPITGCRPDLNAAIRVRTRRHVGLKAGGVNTLGACDLDTEQSKVVEQQEKVMTIVVCDDHPAFAHGLASVLEAETADVKIVGVANSGEDAEQIVRDSLPDIVLMDVRMPGMGGVEATRRIREASPATKVVILTVSEEPADLYGAIGAGASGYVMKDRATPVIVDAIRSVYGGHFVLPAEHAALIVRDLDPTDVSDLNAQERQVLAGIGRGETNRQIARRLSIGERTVKRRVQDIYRKLHLADRVEAAIYGARLQIRTEQTRDPRQTRGP